MEYAARLQGVHRHFGEFHALRGMDLSVRTGTLHAFLGANGAGKSTSVRCLLGLLNADRGELSLLGASPSPEQRAMVGYLPEQRGLYLDSTLLDHLMFLGRLRGLDSKTATTRAMEGLERFGLGDRAKALGKELSKGLQQKVQIAATLMHRPQLLVLDEPFNGLDPMAQRDLEGLLHEVRASGTTILLCTHLIEHAERLASHATLILEGQQVVEDAIDTIRREAWDGEYEVDFEGTTEWLSSFPQVEACPGGAIVRLPDGAKPLMECALANDVPLQGFRRALPSLRDVMLRASA